MFGYVLINKPELKIREYDEYHGFYCGLCHSLKRYGQLSRLTLNYDMTFLAVLLTGLYEPETAIRDYRCPLHPLTKEKIYQNKYIDYCADMTLLLAYYKNLDDINDENRFSAKVANVALKKEFDALRNKYPEKAKKIEEALKELSDLEKTESDEIDYLASASGKMLGEVFAYEDDHWAKDLYNMGFYLGKFIYIMDAYDDCIEDEKKGLFNVVARKKLSREYILDVLNLVMGECAAYFEKLPVLEYAGILRNIIYSGVFARMEEIDKKVEKK